MLKQRKHVASKGPIMSAAKSIENHASSVFVLGARPSADRGHPTTSQLPRPNDLPGLRKQVTIGRNSQFHDMTAEDEKKLGGIEYAALKLLLKILLGIYVQGTIHLAQYANARDLRILLRAASSRCYWPATVDPYCSVKVHRLAGGVRPKQDVVVSISVWSCLAPFLGAGADSGYQM